MPENPTTSAEVLALIADVEASRTNPLLSSVLGSVLMGKLYQIPMIQGSLETSKVIIRELETRVMVIRELQKANASGDIDFIRKTRRKIWNELHARDLLLDEDYNHNPNTPTSENPDEPAESLGDAERSDNGETNSVAETISMWLEEVRKDELSMLYKAASALFSTAASSSQGGGTGTSKASSTEL